MLQQVSDFGRSDLLSKRLMVIVKALILEDTCQILLQEVMSFRQALPQA